MRERPVKMIFETTLEAKEALRAASAREYRSMSLYLHLLLERELLGKGPDGREGQAERDNGANQGGAHE